MKKLLPRALLIASCFLIGFFLMYSPRFAPKDIIEIEEAGESDALKSFEWWYAQRALPYYFIPQGSYQKAANYLMTSMKKEHAISLNGFSTSGWTSMGPTNIGGRVLALAVNPNNNNIVWAGSASGGLWKSISGGTGINAWSYINTGFNTLSVSAIALDQFNPNIMYIGTGEISLYYRPLVGTPGARASYGMGILKSTDGGTTWSQTGLTWAFPEITAVQKIVTNPLNNNTIYAATSEGIYKSTNAGITWMRSDTVLMAMDVVMSPADTSTLFASHGNVNSSPNSGLYKTTNAGVSWLQLTNGLPSTNFGRTSLSISPSNPSMIYAGVSDALTNGTLGLYKSTDNGSSWSLATNTNYLGELGWYANVIAVHPNNSNIIFCAGFDINKSTNGGVLLSAISSGYVHVDHHAIAFDPTNPNVMYFGTDGGVYKTIDGGSTFVNCNSGLVTTQFYPGFANAFSDSTIAIGGLQDNGTLKYTGSGSWTQILGADGGWCAIDPTNSNIMYYEEQWLLLFKSTNGSYGNIVNGLPIGAGNTNFIAPFVIAPSNPNVLYAGCKNVYKTTNGGNFWFSSDGKASQNGTNIACIGVSWTSSDTLLAGTGSGILGEIPKFEIFSSVNGGRNWTNVTYRLNGIDSLPKRYPTDIEFDPTNSTIAYLTFSGYGSPHVFKTTNVGQSWVNISGGLPDIPHQAVTVDPEASENVYLGTDLGVFHSSNGGTSWEEFNLGLPAAMVLDLTVSRANGKLRASTFGNGVYERPLVRIPWITLTAPNGGEIWMTGFTETIRWSQKFLNLLKLEYTTNNGSTWNLIADSVPASQSSYAWLIPPLSSMLSRIRISNMGTGQPIDSSDAMFTFLNPDVYHGWNLISLNVRVSDPRTSALYPTATSSAFRYDGTYIRSDSLFNSIGYWLKFDHTQEIPIVGDSISIDTINVKTGWNMIGSITKSIATSSILEVPPGLITSDYFGYRSSYFPTDSIKPRKGYWVKVHSEGKLVLSTSTYKANQRRSIVKEDSYFNSLTIKDNGGNQQTLFFAKQNQKIQIDFFELPPVPPEGIFDVRFASNRMLELLPEDINQPFEKQIEIRSAIYPLTVSWNILNPDGQYSIVENRQTIHQINGNGNFTISNEVQKLTLRAEAKTENNLPTTFHLYQNYPNPFNPATKIQYSIPYRQHIALRIFDLRGQLVATLVDRIEDAGYKSVEWNASETATGVYFYQLSTETTTEVKKMIIIR